MWNNDAVIVLVEGDVLITLGWRGVRSSLARLLNLRTFIAPKSCQACFFRIFGHSMASPKRRYREREKERERGREIERERCRAGQQEGGTASVSLSAPADSWCRQCSGRAGHMYLEMQEETLKGNLKLVLGFFFFFLKTQHVIFWTIHKFYIGKNLICNP